MPRAPNHTIIQSRRLTLCQILPTGLHGSYHNHVYIANAHPNLERPNQSLLTRARITI